MAIDATATLYRVSKCGFFNEETGEAFGDLKELVPDFGAWLEDLHSVGETVTFEPSQDGESLRVFCLGLIQISGQDAFLFSTWNEVPSLEEGIQLLNVESAIGSAEVSGVAVNPRSLPGYPAYFVIMPSTGRLLNLRFEQRLNGTRGFARHIEGFLASASRYCVWDANDEARLVGYAKEGGVVAEGFDPAFRYVIARRPGQMQYFRSRALEVRKLHRKMIIHPIEVEHRPMFEAAQRFLGMEPNARLRAAIRFTYSYKTRISQDRMNSILEFGFGDGVPFEDGEDIGFTFAKEASKIHWVSGSYARSKVRINADRTPDGMVSLSSLADALAGGALERILDRTNGTS